MVEQITLGTLRLSVKDILVIKGDGNYSNIFTKDGKRFLTCKTLKYFASLLVHNNFIRPSKSSLINKDFIVHIEFNSNKAIHLVNGDVISISRRNVRPLREKYQA